jgi:hypothetical protein
MNNQQTTFNMQFVFSEQLLLFPIFQQRTTFNFYIPAKYFVNGQLMKVCDWLPDGREIMCVWRPVANKLYQGGRQ